MNGLRISEVLDADVDDLTTERGHRVLMITRKGGKKATIPLAPRTAEAVDAYVSGRVTGPLFITASGKRWQRSEVWRTLRRLARVAVPGKATTIHPHDLEARVCDLEPGRRCEPAGCSGRRRSRRPEDDQTVRPSETQLGPASDVPGGGDGEASMLKPANLFAIRSVSKIEQEVRS